MIHVDVSDRQWTVSDRSEQEKLQIRRSRSMGRWIVLEKFEPGRTMCARLRPSSQAEKCDCRQTVTFARQGQTPPTHASHMGSASSSL